MYQNEFYQKKKKKPTAKIKFDLRCRSFKTNKTIGRNGNLLFIRLGLNVTGGNLSSVDFGVFVPVGIRNESRISSAVGRFYDPPIYLSTRISYCIRVMPSPKLNNLPPPPMPTAKSIRLWKTLGLASHRKIIHLPMKYSITK